MCLCREDVVEGWMVKAWPVPTRQAARARCEILGMAVVYSLGAMKELTSWVGDDD